MGSGLSALSRWAIAMPCGLAPPPHPISIER